MKVLIVEDDSNMRKMIRLTFEFNKCITIEAKDGKEGLELATLHKPDLIISDAFMPRMDGFQLLRALKTEPELKLIPFIFYSAIYDGYQEEKLALSLGAEAFIDKPTEPDELWNKISAIMKVTKTKKALVKPQIEKDDEQYLNDYCQIVATKLEEKVQELEEALALRKDAEYRLKRLNAELEKRVSIEVEKNIEKDRIMAHQARLAAMGEMLSNIAHQWRQPLNNVALIVQNLQSEYEENILNIISCSDYVSECMKYLTFMSSTIDKFRAFYQPDHKQQLFNPYDAISEIIPLIKDDMDFHQISLKLTNENSILIYGYKNEFVQVIMNLIMNAKEAILKKQPLKPVVEILCTKNDGEAIIKIADNGCGISSEILDKIFDPYFTTKFMSQGVGMGLYMSKMIIEKHMGGRIDIDNTNDLTAFTLKIPNQQVTQIADTH